MIVTTDMVLHRLGEYEPVSSIKTARHYLFPCLLTPDGECTEACLYLSALSQAIPALRERPQLHFVCVNDMDEKGFVPENVILLSGELSLNKLLWSLQSYFAEIQAWSDSMRNAVLGGCSYQNLFDLAEPVLQCTAVAMDPGFSMVACTKNTATDDPLMNQILRQGYHTLDTQRNFRKGGLLSAYSKTTGLVVTNAGVYSKHATAGCWLRWQGKTLLGITAICQSDTFPSYLLDLFEIFISAMAYCFEREQRMAPAGGQRYESLLRSLAFGDVSSKERTRERAEAVGLPFEGPFRLYKIGLKETDKFSVERMRGQIETALPRAYSIHFENNLLVLHRHRGESTKGCAEMFLPVMEEFGLSCGVSRDFEELTQLHSAYLQAAAAAELGTRLWAVRSVEKLPDSIGALLSLPGQRYIYSYNDLAEYHRIEMAMAHEQCSFEFDPYVRAVRKLMEYDSRKNTAYYWTLFAFLSLDRNTTQTARVLNIHRTQLQYHIDKIRSITGYDFDDRAVRSGFLTAYQAEVLALSKSG